MSSKSEKRKKSGNENKKSREYSKAAKMSRKLEDVFRTRNDEVTGNSEENIDDSEKPSAEENDGTFEDETSGNEYVVVEESEVVPPSPDLENVDVLRKGLLDLTAEFPSDPIHWENKPVTPELIRSLLNVGPCQPGKDCKFDYPATGVSNRKFVKDWYWKKIPNGETVERKWLSYSPCKNKMFCFPCMLFADKRAPGYDSSFALPSAGCQNYKKGKYKIVNHENSLIHGEAVSKMLITIYNLEKNTTVVKGIAEGERKLIEKNRAIVKRLVDVTLFLSKQNLPFRGHREKGGKGADADNEGNFIELIKLLSQYDPLLEQHLESSNKNETYLSHDIQNDLILALANCTSEKIVECVKAAKYYALILDGTIDLSRTDQCSISLRYVNKDGRAEEHFVSFEELEGGSSDDYFNALMGKLEEMGIDITDCRGQAYDGASTMSGHLSGLQKRVKDLCGTTAIYVHCCAHILNLVLCEVAGDSSNEAKLFFGTLERAYKFMSESLPRLHVLRKRIADDEIDSALSLKRHSDTRWSSRKKCVDAILSCLPQLYKALEDITEGKEVSLTPKAFAEGHGLLQQLKTFNFHFELISWQQVLNASQILSSYLQSATIDVSTASNLITGFKESIYQMRTEDNFEKIKIEANELMEKCCIESHFNVSRKFPTIDDFYKYLKCDVFYPMLDRTSSELEIRFDDILKTCTLFSALEPKNFHKNGNLDQLKHLSNTYDKDVDLSSVQFEYTAMMNTLHGIFKDDKLKDMPTSNQVLPFLIESGMENLFPNVCTLYRIFLTIPVSSAHAERSFSRLKLIKSYLRTMMGQERLSSLALLSIERELSTSCNYDAVIDNFAIMKNRRKKL